MNGSLLIVPRNKHVFISLRYAQYASNLESKNFRFYRIYKMVAFPMKLLTVSQVFLTFDILKKGRRILRD